MPLERLGVGVVQPDVFLDGGDELGDAVERPPLDPSSAELGEPSLYEVAANPTDALVFAVYSPSVPEFLELAREAAEGLVWSTVTGTYGDEMGQRFMRQYTQCYGCPPGRSHAGIAYDEIHLIARAWSAVENPRDFRAMADRLRRVPHRGVNGSYFLDNERQSGLAYPDMTPDPSLGQAHLVLQIQDGNHRILSPSPYVEAEFCAPPWWKQPHTRPAQRALA